MAESAIAADPDAAYLKLVDAAAASPKAAPWCEIRKAYPGTSFYRAHGGTDLKKMTAEAGKKILIEKTPAAVAAFREFMRGNGGSAGAHFYAAYLFDWNRDLVRQKMDPLLPDFGHGIDYIDGDFERIAAAALLDCIVAGADGISLKTAYEVISLDEEELVADKYYHVEPLSLAGRIEGGVIYNVMTVVIPGTRTPITLYFRPSRVLADTEMADSLARHMAAKKSTGDVH